MNNDINAFIEHARSKGMDHATIRTLLLSAGWKERDVVEALAETTLDVPIPVPPERGGARDAFFQLTVTASYYAALIAVTVILFTAIDRALPDPAMRDRFDRWELSTIRWSLAFVMIAYPLFLWFSRIVRLHTLEAPERAFSGMRRGLTYLTIFLAGLALAIDLVTLIYYMLEGELTTRFLLKVAVVLALAGFTCAYFLLSLRWPVTEPGRPRWRRAFLIASVAIVAGTVAWGFAITGTPAAERERKLDDRRVRDLRQIREELTNLCLGASRHLPVKDRSLEQALPETLAELRKRARGRRPDIADRETGELYLYEVTGPSSFRLGARFTTVRDESPDPFWNHQATTTWFDCDLLTD